MYIVRWENYPGKLYLQDSKRFKTKEAAKRYLKKKRLAGKIALLYKSKKASHVSTR